MIARKIVVGIYGVLFSFATIQAQSITWPELAVENYPGARWWWMGSAVDKENLSYNMEQYSIAGIKSLEITPIYGVMRNEKKEIDFLSPQWMEMLSHTQSEGKRLGMQIDMNTGTGWPFGGPEVSLEDAATKVFFQEYKLKGGESLKNKIEIEDEKQKPIAALTRVMAFGASGEKIDLTDKIDEQGKLNWKAPKGGEWRLIAVFNGRTFQKVKRAAPGGEGYVMDHLSHKAVGNYLNRFEQAFRRSGTSYPDNFFNDSYEVYKADWTDDFLEQFEKRRGYKLEEFLPEFLAKERTDVTARLISDYRETMSELLLENFTRQWTQWAHSHGSLTRNQAHGSPANLIDIYANVDIPECEGFGISDFGIKGLRQDSLTRPNDSDFSMLKYASSAAHIAGKQYTSSETFTWLTEHFRTSLSQCKPEIDLLFVSGVNRVYFHGTTYSPKEDQWPGWKFYASVDMSPTNSIWRDAPAFFEYIARCQSFLQMGQPHNDFLLYVPIYDIWHEQDGRMLMFDIHKMAKRAPGFIEAVNEINDCGYDFDYISDNFIRSTKVVNGKLQTQGGATYEAIIIPGVKKMPLDVLEHLIDLVKKGAKVVFMEQYPESVPGLAHYEEKQKRFEACLSELPEISYFDRVEVSELGKGQVITGDEYDATLDMTDVVSEHIKDVYGIPYIRRINETGFHYFISNLRDQEMKDWITLSVPAKSVSIFNPVTGEIGKARMNPNSGDLATILLELKSGESLILKTYTDVDVDLPEWKYPTPQTMALSLENNWKLHFVESVPVIDLTFQMGQLKSWTELSLPSTKENMGTGCYSVTFELPAIAADDWVLDLGDVRESARVKLNGNEIGTLWSVPFTIKVGDYLKPGENYLEVEVTNLPANRIADYDRRGVPWRKFKDINIANIHYKPSYYENWEVVPSGLLGPVKLIPVNYK